MPYNPQVADVSGQLRAQGIAASGASIAQGINQFAQTYQQNQILSQTAVGKFLAASKADPDFVKPFETGNAPPDAQAAYDSLKKSGHVKPAQAAMLSAFADSYSDQKKQAAENQFRAQQAALFAQQAAAQQREMENQQRASQALGRAAQPQSPMGQAIQGGADFQQLGGMSTQPQQPSMQEVWQRFAQSGAPMTPEVERFLSSGMAAEQRAEAAKAKPTRSVEPVSYRSADDKGRPIEVTVDKLTGQKIGQGPLQAQPEVPNPLVEKIYGDLSTERKDLVMPAINTLRTYSEIDRVLNSKEGAITGVTAKPELYFKRVLSAAGDPNPEVVNTQKLQALFAQPVANMIKSFGSGTGLSDADREFALKAVGGDITLDAAAIKELVRIGKQASQNVVKNYQSRLDEVFAGDSDNKQHQLARKALSIPSVDDLTKGAVKALDQATALKYLQQAGGDKAKARELAAKDGWSF